MAMIKCPECGMDVSSLAASCPYCGCPISSYIKEISVTFQNIPFQLLNKQCYVYNSKGMMIAECRQGETVKAAIDGPQEISVCMFGYFGKPTIYAEPGKHYKVSVKNGICVKVKEIAAE